MAAFVALSSVHGSDAAVSNSDCELVISSKAGSLENFAAREVRRYIYLRTGEMLPIRTGGIETNQAHHAIVIGRKELLEKASSDEKLTSILQNLAPQQYLIRRTGGDLGSRLWIAGGDEAGTLYGTYRFIESLGVRFYLHGDVIPDALLQALPQEKGSTNSVAESALVSVFRSFSTGETVKPLFELRGIQPFHDFPEGPDWWNRDDYLAILSQLPKLGMNFFGLHTYPEGNPNAEPTVWIGLEEDLKPNGQVKFAYPSSWFNTWRGNWGYSYKKTSDYSHGTSMLFERDAFGAEVLFDLCPQPEKKEPNIEMFTRSAALLRDAFQHARQLGIKTCVGTETPLTIPKTLMDHLKDKGRGTNDQALIKDLYKGIFQWVSRNYPADYYWFWTPETWTWEGTKPEQIRATTNDLAQAMAAAAEVNAPFQLATCGWVLGPAEDRALFDKFLPKSWPVSCINREVGNEPVEPGFAKTSGRPKWAIPWMEDDPSLTAPQLWVGRMRQDALDAFNYGCNGLFGIHWRTRVLAPNVSALAKAGWSQASWRKDNSEIPGWSGGKTASFTEAITNTSDAPIYQDVRYSVSSYRLKVPNGHHKVTLQFCEPVYSAPAKRVFGIRIQGNTVIDRLDVFDMVGKCHALDCSFDGVAVTNGTLLVEFTPIFENPLIAGLIIEGEGSIQKINCGGSAWKDYSADLPQLPRGQPVLDFYQDWAECEFGPAVSEEAAQILAQIDGRLHKPASWVEGPGCIAPDSNPWEQVRTNYIFVDRLNSLRDRVSGVGSLERFDYWLNTFQYMRAMAHLNCVWGEYKKNVDLAKKETDVSAKHQLLQTKVLPLRQEMLARLNEVYDYLLLTVSNPGELGTIANWEQHILPALVDKTAEELAAIQGDKLVFEVPFRYSGPARLIVPTVRTSLGAEETLSLKVLFLAQQSPARALFFWRPLGEGVFKSIPVQKVARGVYVAELPSREIAQQDFEYYIEAAFDKGEVLRFPATAPIKNQTVVIMPTR